MLAGCAGRLATRLQPQRGSSPAWQQPALPYKEYDLKLRVLTTATDRPTARTSTFLFTDIEGSTRLIQALGDAYADLLDVSRQLIGEAVELNGGRVFGSEGDALFAAFSSASSAIAAGAAAQRALGAHQWGEGSEIRVRIGIHTGEALLTGGNYVGLALHAVARIIGRRARGRVPCPTQPAAWHQPCPKAWSCATSASDASRTCVAPEDLPAGGRGPGREVSAD